MISATPNPLSYSTITYNEIMQQMSNQLSNAMFYASLMALFYVIMNMYVFKDGARFREKFDKLYDENNLIMDATLGAWIFEITEMIGIASVLVLVGLNTVYKFGVNI